jgi:hypothetical protein
MFSQKNQKMENLYKCPVANCWLMFAKKSKIAAHVERLHFKSDTETQKCMSKNCTFVYDSKLKYDIHFKTQHNCDLFTCETFGCNVVFQTKKELDAHMLNEIQGKCDLCKVVCDSISTLKVIN